MEIGRHPLLFEADSYPQTNLAPLKNLQIAVVFRESKLRTLLSRLLTLEYIKVMVCKDVYDSEVKAFDGLKDTYRNKVAIALDVFE